MALVLSEDKEGSNKRRIPAWPSGASDGVVVISQRVELETRVQSVAKARISSFKLLLYDLTDNYSES